MVWLPAAYQPGVVGTCGGRAANVVHEMALLRDAYLEMLEGGGTSFVTMTGEAGVGKSRLLYEFEDWLELRPEGKTIFNGRASGTAQRAPFSLVRDLFARQFEILESGPPAEALAKFRRGMAGLLPAEQADPVGQLVGFEFAAGSAAVQGMLSSEGFGRVAGHHFVEYFRGLLARQPVVMLLEDLHWADDSSLDLLRQLVGQLPGARLLIVSSARPGLYERRPNWGEGKAGHIRLALQPLSRRASQELVDKGRFKVIQLFNSWY